MNLTNLKIDRPAVYKIMVSMCISHDVEASRIDSIITNFRVRKGGTIDTGNLVQYEALIKEFEFFICGYKLREAHERLEK